MRSIFLICFLFLYMAPEAKADQCKYSNGKCVDSNNNECSRALNPSELFKDYDKQLNGYSNVNAECINFTGFDFNQYIDFKFRKLVKWNFKGANLTKAKLFFASVIDSDLQGTNFEELSFGYVEIDGTVDEQTKLPKYNCAVDKNKVHCRQ